MGLRRSDAVQCPLPKMLCCQHVALQDIFLFNLAVLHHNGLTAYFAALIRSVLRCEARHNIKHNQAPDQVLALMALLVEQYAICAWVTFTVICTRA